MNTVIIALCLALPLSSAFAATQPREGRLDPRVKQVEYQEGQVYQVHAHYLQTTMITFADDEEIVHVSMGDPVAWSPQTVNNYIALKPLLEKADTNMNLLTKNITTGKIRAYVFELKAQETHSIAHRSGTFMMTFSYPQDDLRKQMEALSTQQKKANVEVVLGRKTAAQDWNMEYTYAGSQALVPVRVFDDGMFTYFKFPKKMDTPALFLVADDNSESLVNFHVKGEYMVVQRTGRQFILRDGIKATCIFNTAYRRRDEGTVLQAEVTATMATDGESEL
jgi:type IV secretion system protein VirB9